MLYVLDALSRGLRALFTLKHVHSSEKVKSVREEKWREGGVGVGESQPAHDSPPGAEEEETGRLH